MTVPGMKGRAGLSSEQDLIRRANEGEEAAFTQLYTDHREWVIGMARQICRNEADALDVLQEVYRYWFGKFPGFRLTCQIRTFLYPVVRNRALDVVRRAKRFEALPDDHEDTAGGGERDHAAERAQLVDRIAGLPEKQREVVLLRFADGMSLEEIGAALGIRLGTVKSRLHNALRSLRR